MVSKFNFPVKALMQADSKYKQNMLINSIRRPMWNCRDSSMSDYVKLNQCAINKYIADNSLHPTNRTTVIPESSTRLRMYTCKL